MFRPRVKDLEFHLYSRPVHPELFETCALCQVKQNDFQISVRITPSGHVLTFRNPLFWLTEVTAVRHQLLPANGHLLKHRFQGGQCDDVSPAPAFRYRTVTEIEELNDECFEKVQDEIIAAGRKGGLLHRFSPNNRIFLSPVSHMSVQARQGLISMTALHTYPGENTVVKTISLIEKT